MSGLTDLNLKKARDAADKNVLEIALSLTQGNVVQTAKLLGCARATVYDLIERHAPKRSKVKKRAAS